MYLMYNYSRIVQSYIIIALGHCNTSWRLSGKLISIIMS